MAHELELRLSSSELLLEIAYTRDPNASPLLSFWMDEVYHENGEVYQISISTAQQMGWRDGSSFVSPGQDYLLSIPRVNPSTTVIDRAVAKFPTATVGQWVTNFIQRSMSKHVNVTRFDNAIMSNAASAIFTLPIGSSIGIPMPNASSGGGLQNAFPGYSVADDEVGSNMYTMIDNNRENKKKVCTHTWKFYYGFTDQFEYCTVCDSKRAAK